MNLKNLLKKPAESIDEGLARRFRRFEDGRLAYYPKGMLSRGFMIDPPQADALKSKLRSLTWHGFLIMLGGPALLVLSFRNAGDFMEFFIAASVAAVLYMHLKESALSRSLSGTERAPEKPYPLREHLQWALVQKGAPATFFFYFTMLPNWSAVRALFREEHLTWRGLLGSIAASRGRAKCVLMFVAAAAGFALMTAGSLALLLLFGVRHWPAIIILGLYSGIIYFTLCLEYLALACLSFSGSARNEGGKATSDSAGQEKT
jgi:hypothetical protein